MRQLLLAALLLLPSAGWAGAWSKGCQFTGGDVAATIGTPQNTNKAIHNGEFGCYRFNNADGAHNSGVFIQVEGPTATITFDPDLGATTLVATAALVEVHFCPQGAPINTTNPEFSCPNFGGAGANLQLDGVEGPSSTQNQQIRVGTGVYYFRVTGACVAAKTCQVAVKGEGNIL